MKIKIATDYDKQQLLVISGLNNPRSLATLIAAIANKCEPAEDFECIIRKDQLSHSYRSNPTIFALKVKEKTGFVDYAGYQTPQATNFISIILFRKEKGPNARRYQPSKSVKQSIKDWLDLNLAKEEILVVKMEDIPPFYRTHPEQLTYQINREMEVPIKINRYKLHWKITRK